MTDAEASVQAKSGVTAYEGAECSARAALDTAQQGIQSVAKMLGNLDQAGKTVDPAESLDFRPVSECLMVVLQARKRDEALQALVKRIAFELPGCTVRLAMGRSEMKSLIDHRLGWLAAGNEIHQEMVQIYRDDRSKWEDQGGRDARLRCGSGFWILDLSWDGGPQRCVLFLQAREAQRSEEGGARTTTGIDEERLQWLSASGDVLSEAIASRPVVNVPRVVNLVGHRPLFTILSTMFLMALLAAWPVHYPVVCEAMVEPLHPRVVASPFDATLAQLHVRPGDEVTAGQVLLELDGRPLRIELEAIQAEIKAIEKDHNVALATNEIAAAQKANLQRQKLTHRRELLENRLQKLAVVSPVDGMVIAGDLEKFVGSPLTVGQSLLEVAPLHRVAIEVQIPEFEISLVEPTARTRVRFAAVGGESLHGNLDEVYPAAEIRDDQNVFLGRMTVDNLDGRYRPGMKGQALAYGPLRPLIWSYVRGGWEQLLWWVGF